jgi:hypothetical protein
LTHLPLRALFFAPAPDPAAEAGFLAAGVGPAAPAQLGLQGRHLQVIHRQVVEQGLAGDGLEVRREIDEGALAARQVRVLCRFKQFVPKKINQKLNNIPIQGGQMKSGQILSHNNSKTVLNIIFKFFTLVTEYISCLQRPVEAQWLQVSDLWQRLRGQRLKDSAP